MNKSGEKSKFNQFKTVFGFEFAGYVKNKVFIGITLFLIAAVVVLMFFPRVRDAFKGESEPETENGAGSEYVVGDADSDREGLPVMLLSKGENGELTDMIYTAFFTAFDEYDVRVYDGGTADTKRMISDGEAECAFVFDSKTEFTYYVENLSMYDMNSSVAESVLENVYKLTAMTENGISDEKAAEIMSTHVTCNTEKLGVDQMHNFIYTYVLIMVLYMAIILYGQMVSQSVASEKSSRAMELLITSADTTPMIFGKVLAACAAGFMQIALVLGGAFVSYNLNRSYWGSNELISSIFDIPAGLIGYMLVFFVLGFLVYAFLYGAVGSTASKTEDTKTTSMPITLLFVVGFMIVISSISGGVVDNTLMKVCSFIPFTSPMAMFARIAMSTVPAYEIAISVAILAASVAAIGYISSEIYRIGVLMYGKPPKLSEVLKSLKKSR